MATIWKGAINFGLINVPVKLLSAVMKEDVAFRMLHKKCKTPLNQKRWCPECGEEVAYVDTVKGYEYEKGSFVEITEEDLASVTVASTKYIQIIDFISLSEVDPIYFEKSYYLSPEAAGEKPYVILHGAMCETNAVAVSKITIREREHLCIVRVYEDILMLNTMFFGNEIKSTAEINMDRIHKKIKVSNAEAQMAKEIITNLTAKFDDGRYVDDYNAALTEMISMKIEGKEIIQPEHQKSESKDALDLFEKLRKSVEATKRAPKTASASNPPKAGKGDSANASAFL